MIKEEISSLLCMVIPYMKGFFNFNRGCISPIWYVVGEAKQPLKRRRKVSSADAESEPPYNIPSPYL